MTNSCFEFTGTAHAKVILFGEHFVLPWEDSQGGHQPGAAAVALPLPKLFTEVTLSEASHSSENLFSYEPHENDSPSLDREYLLSLMQKACSIVALAVQWDLQQFPLQLSSRSRFPVSRGFGSSAAFSVALVRAFLKLKNQKEMVNMERLVQKIENLFHGKSSGIDTAAVLNSSPILFREGKVLQTIKQRAVDFVILDSSPRDNSFHWIQKTLDFRNRNPAKWAEFSKRIHQFSMGAVEYLAKNEGLQNICDAVNETEEILSSMGLVTERMKELIAYGFKMGARAGKMSGAGGGGAMIFLTDPGKGQLLADAFFKKGVQVLSILNADCEFSQSERYRRI